MPRASKALDAKKVGKVEKVGKVGKVGKKAAAAAAASGPGEAAGGVEAAGSKTTAPKKAAAKKTSKTARRTKEAGGQAAASPVESDKFLQEQLALLDAERATYVEQAAALKAEADQLAQEMEPGDIQFDDESGEGGTANVDRERDLALSAQARVAVDEIDHARQKIATGTYGNCERCGQPIPRARLKALPHARMCGSCKSGGLSRR